MVKKQYEELTFSDDFMFCKVLQNNPDLCRELLELILEEPVGELVTLNKQHPIEITANNRGVRFDIYAHDDRSVIYDIDMQNAYRDHLPKRVRYVQSLMDLDILERGDHFRDLQRSYVIFICNFNLYEEHGRHRYSFKNLCVEDPKIELADETQKIFLCTKGTKDDISEEMKQFLAYVAGKAPENDFTKRLESAVAKAKRNPAWRKEFMDFRDYLDDAREEGRQEERENTKREKARAEAAEILSDRLRAELEKYKEKYGTLFPEKKE